MLSSRDALAGAPARSPDLTRQFGVIGNSDTTGTIGAYSVPSAMKATTTGTVRGHGVEALRREALALMRRRDPAWALVRARMQELVKRQEKQQTKGAPPPGFRGLS